MSFLVAIIGRANVGKSTLFNVLTSSQDALVFDFEGVTRDRQYAQAKYDDLDYLLVDTAGISDSDKGFNKFMTRQSEIAVNEANLIFFVVDGKSGLTAGDQYVADFLRQRSKKAIIVVNKVEQAHQDVATADFYKLGFDKVFAISAAHRRNIQKLLDKYLKKPLLEYYKDYTQTIEHKEKVRHGIHFSIIGKPNVGKSTLTNKMLKEERVMVFDMPGTTIDSIAIAFKRYDKAYTIIDTAGVRKRSRIKETLEKFSIIKTLKAIQDSNVVVIMVEAKVGISEQDLRLINFAVKNGRALVIAINKWDSLCQESKIRVKQELKRRLYFLADYVDIHFISALHATNVDRIFDSIETAYKSANKKITSANATRLLQLAIQAHCPPMAGKFRIKLKYAHVGGHNPPVIVIHGNQVAKLPNSYKKYLENYFREALEFRGTPIVFEFRQSKNPFVDKKR